jgi:hypothetical protein
MGTAPLHAIKVRLLCHKGGKWSSSELEATSSEVSARETSATAVLAGV